MTAVTVEQAREGIVSRVLRASSWAGGGHLLSQAIRLGTNLVLTRLLVPEDFGLMALVTAVLIGMTMLSDVGIGPAVMSSRHGDEPRFLHTAWTIQVVRGLVLWIVCAGIAIPLAMIFSEPRLVYLLPVAGLTLFINGFTPSKVYTVNRHLQLGRLTALDLASQAISVVVLVGLALAWPSVWVLVIGTVVASVAHLVLCRAYLRGDGDRFCWDPEFAGQLLHFGRWIILSTLCGYITFQGDKLILGYYLPLDLLGIYNIGFFLAGFPLALGQSVSGRVLIPLYREQPPSASRENYARVRLIRFVMTGAIAGMLAVMAIGGDLIIDLLYDDRYQLASPILVLIALTQVPAAILMTYDQVALAHGDSRRFFIAGALKAATFLLLFVLGMEYAGLVGAIVGNVIALAVGYPITVWLARRYGAWDPLHDGFFLAVLAPVLGLSLWLHWPDVVALSEAGWG